MANGFIGLDVRPIGDPWGLETSTLLGRRRSQQRHIAMHGDRAVVVAVLFAFFRYTRMGLAMRAAAYDQEAALAQGVNVGAVFALSWALAGGAGRDRRDVRWPPAAGVDRQLWIIALVALPVDHPRRARLAARGGGRRPAGRCGRGAGRRPTRASSLPWLGDNFAVVTPYVVMLLVLLVRPYGLFGTPEVERV